MRPSTHNKQSPDCEVPSIKQPRSGQSVERKVSEMRSVFAIRAHEPSPAVERLHAALSRLAPADHRIVVVVDEMHGVGRRAWPVEYDLVSINDRLLESVGIRTDIPDAGWRCGDYAYYALAADREFKYAWLIEPDVVFEGLDLESFFSELDASDADLIAPDILPAPGWLWSYQLTERGITSPWRCFFPLTRLSRRGIEAARRLRTRIQWIDAANYGHPNDEGVVATAVAAGGLTMSDLRLAYPRHFAHFHHRPKLQSSTITELFGGPSILHPCVDQSGFVRGLRRELLRAARDDLRGWVRGRRGSAKRTLETLGDFALLTDRHKELHRLAFGPPDAQFGAYGREFRHHVLRTLPLDVRALLVASAGLVMLGQIRSAKARS